MSETEHLFGDAHVRRYRETGGEVSHIWRRWYRNPAKDPNVEVQVQDDVHAARARTAAGAERERLWRLAAQQWPDYDAYQQRTDREIPVVVLERVPQP